MVYNPVQIFLTHTYSFFRESDIVIHVPVAPFWIYGPLPGRLPQDWSATEE